MKTTSEWIRDCAEADFDGHTEFDSMNAEQRLDWLAQVAVFACRQRLRASAPSAPDSDTAAPVKAAR